MMAVRLMSVSPAASSKLQEPDSAELGAAADPEAFEETAEDSEAAETVESSEPEESRESTSMPETASGSSEPSSEDPAVSAGDVRPSEASVSGGDPAVPGTAAPSEVTVSGGDALPSAKDTITKPYDASADYSGLEDLFAELQETGTAQLESLTRIEAQNEAVISILLIILVVGLLHYIYRFLKIFV